MIAKLKKTANIVHGTPITPKSLLPQLRGHSFCVSFADPRQVEDVIELVGDDGVVLLDNGAFSHWRAGKGAIDQKAFWAWAEDILARCPQAVAVIPDVIEGSEEENLEASYSASNGRFDDRKMFVWHLDDSLETLRRAARCWRFIAFGSCAEYDVQKNRAAYLARIEEARRVIEEVEAEPGHPGDVRVHLMRGLGLLHLAPWAFSADSTNVARNHCRTKGAPNHVAAMASRIAEKVRKGLDTYTVERVFSGC